ncbi:U3 small nucleolar RNA-associated protein 6-domain-containing protein [Sporodiniella umbellata]|nr:U3 small nucleolar RNA-associated protein 6-domain-containing protein [Sporodiniella umbellata]
MAEQVHFQLERMLPELEALEKKKLFSAIEIKTIIKKRTNFEYALHRRIKKKIDFLRCIEYEMNLEKLLKKRIDRLGCTFELSEKNLEYAGIKRIYGLFKRATKKFTGDITLWLQYIDFAKKNDSSNVLSGIFVEAIQYHPMNASIWVMAASWEHEHNHNIAAARSLMQRAIRLMPENKLLWHEYFRLELIYVEKILLRRQVLGIQQAQPMETSEEDSTHLVLPALTGEDMDEWKEDKEKFKITEQTAASLENDANPILNGLLAKIVYDNAIEAIANDLEFRKEFIQIYLEFSHAQDKISYVYETIRRDMSGIPEARALLAERHLLHHNKPIAVHDPLFFPCLRKCVDDYDEALEALDTVAMNECFIRFVLNWYRQVSEPTLQLYFQKLAQKTFKRCRNQNRLSKTLFEQWAVLEHDNPKVIESGLAMYPDSIALWLRQIELSPCPLTVYSKALTANRDSLRLWSEYVAYLVSQWETHTLDTQETRTLFSTACDQATALLPSATAESSDRNAIKVLLQSRYVAWAAQAGGIALARSVYQHILTKHYPTYEFIMKSLDIENTHGDKQSGSGPVEHLLEKLLTIPSHPKSESYITYLSYLYSQNQHNKATKVYNRACKEVENKEAFDLQVKALLDKK